VHLNKTIKENDYDQVEYQILTNRKNWANPDNCLHHQYQRAILRRFCIILLGFTLSWIVLFYDLESVLVFTLGLAGAYTITIFTVYFLVPLGVILAKQAAEYLNGS